MQPSKINIASQEGFQFSIDGHFIEMSPLALAIIDDYLREMRLNLDRPVKYLEFGSGASTAYFAQKYPEMEIYSVEGNKEWFELVKGWVTPKEYKYHEATNYYTSDPSCNMSYITCMEEFGPFDFILNDGAQREMVNDHILANPDKYIAKGGIYLRHDYEKFLIGDWVGYHLPEKAQTVEEFASKNLGYSVITINGNGKWGYKCELGGLWRK